ncbi:MAG: type II secretion system F family protein, partial [Nitrospirae bacterium]|nr:type II secretion system F family protein [Nitrospirota bacterium]
MPIYRYKARDKYGTLFAGTMESTGQEGVAGQLDGMGYVPVLIEEDRKGIFTLPGRIDIFRRVTPQDMIVFSRQLATLISAGLPFVTSFETLIEQTENEKFREVLTRVKRDVEGGSTFADALARHPKVFSSLYVSMIRAGELGGVLDDILGRLARLAEHEAETRSRVKAATRYPLIVVAAIVVAFIVLVTLVVPKFADIYAGFKVELPLPTRILIGLNTFIQHYWLPAIMGIAAAVWGIQRYVGTKAGRLRWDRLKLKLPVFGPIVLKGAMSRFARMFGTLVRSG